MPQSFDAIIVGAGQAGPPLAKRLVKAGRRVAIVERHLFGGTCVNTGCTPTKAYVASAHAIHLTRRAQDFGFSTGPLSVSLATIKARKDAILEQSRSSVESSLKELEGCTVFAGQASFLSPTELQVAGDTLAAPLIFLNVGARAATPKIDGLGTVPWLSNTGILALTDLPGHLAILGGSYIALEFAQMFRRFGSRVTILERSAQLTSHEDADIACAVHDLLAAEGIDLRLNAHTRRVEPSPAGGIAIHLAMGDTIACTHLLVATGRTPNTDDLNCSAAGLALDERGYVQVDHQLRTGVPGIYALGDCNGQGAFTHTAYNDFEIVADNLLSGAHRSIAERIPCSAMYTDPPLAHIGLTETEVRRTGKPALMATMPMSQVNRAREKGETQGLMKVLVDTATNRILGATIFGTGGDEAIHAILAAMYSGNPYPTLAHEVHIHPTVAELIPTLLQSLKPLE